MKSLPRDKHFTLNAFEFGWIRGALTDEIMTRMEKECPVAWLQFQIAFCESYADADSHPFQEQAKKDLVKYKKKLDKALKKEKI